MKKSELQYISDTILVEKIAAIEFGLIKEAGLFDSLGLGGVASSIKGFVNEHVREDAPGGYVGSVLSLMVPAVLWRMNPLISIIYSIAAGFGFDIQSVISKIINALKPKLERGEQVSAEEVNSIGKSVVAAHAGTNSEGALDDLFAPLRKMDINGDLQKLAIWPFDRERRHYYNRSSSLWELIKNIFSRSPYRGRSLLGAFAIWIIKTVLLSAGLLAGGSAIAGMFGHKKDELKKEEPDKTEQSTMPSEVGSSYTQVPVAPVKSQVPSNELWVVPLVGSGVDDTLIAWTLDLYPNLEKYDNIENIIESTPSFRATAALLTKDPHRVGKKSLVMPKEFNDRRQVVDTFIDDVIRNLK